MISTNTSTKIGTGVKMPGIAGLFDLISNLPDDFVSKEVQRNAYKAPTAFPALQIDNLPRHYMLDIETFGTEPGSVIRSIGCIAFCNTGVLDEFYAVLDTDSQISQGFIVNAATVKWWSEQGAEAQAAFNVTNKVKIRDALLALTEFMQKGKIQGVWGCGSDFDNVLVEEAYRKVGLQAPWKFFQNRCYRTMKSLKPNVKMQRKGVFHNALDDAKSQTVHLLEILKDMKIKI